MAVTVALRPPDQAAVLEKAVVARQADPAVRRRRFAEQHAALAGSGIDCQHVQPRLRAFLALDVERLAIGRPVDPGKVDVLVRPEIDLDLAAAIRVHHPQRDQRVGRSRHRIALLKGPGTLRADCGAGDDPDRGIVEPLDRDAAVVGRPPVAGEAGHFLLRDEFGLAPVNGLGRFLGRDRARLGTDLAGPQPPVAHERDIAAARAERGVELVTAAVGQPADLAVKPGQEQIAIERDQDRLAIGCPVIADDALEITDPLAFALHLFGFGQLLARPQLEAVNQHGPLPGRAIIAPQVIALAIVGSGPQHGQPAPVGRKLDPARHCAVQAGTGEDALEIERPELCLR